MRRATVLYLHAQPCALSTKSFLPINSALPEPLCRLAHCGVLALVIVLQGASIVEARMLLALAPSSSSSQAVFFPEQADF